MVGNGLIITDALYLVCTAVHCCWKSIHEIGTIKGRAEKRNIRQKYMNTWMKGSIEEGTQCCGSGPQTDPCKSTFLEI